MKFRIITRCATESEWLYSKLYSDAKEKPGFFIYQRYLWFFWKKLEIGKSKSHAGFYYKKRMPKKILAII